MQLIGKNTGVSLKTVLLAELILGHSFKTIRCVFSDRCGSNL